MINRIFAIIACASLAGCATNGTDAAGTESEIQTKSFVYQALPGQDASIWMISEGVIDDGSQHTRRSAENARLTPDGLYLAIKPRPQPDQPSSSAEYTTRDTYGLGRYEFLMQPAASVGMVTNLLVYSPGNEARGVLEVGLQVLGKDTSMVHPTLVTRGERVAFAPHQLGFPTSQKLHLFAFERDEDAVRWYFNDELIQEYSFTDRAPDTAEGAIVINLWSATEHSAQWLGAPRFDTPQESLLRCVSFVAAGEKGEQCSSTFAD